MKEIRTRNAKATRKAILESARHQFLKDGYDHAGLRAIAADAGIDAALIYRYFSSKKQLFAEVLKSTSNDPMQIFRGDLSSCGERVARAVLVPVEDKLRQVMFIGLVSGAASSPEARDMAHQHIEKQFMRPLCTWLGGASAYEKAWLIGSILMGAVIMARIRPVGEEGCVEVGKLIQDIIDRKEPIGVGLGS